jgi:hypothetical protein
MNREDRKFNKVLRHYLEAIEMSEEIGRAVHVFRDPPHVALASLHDAVWPAQIWHACQRNPQNFDDILAIEVFEMKGDERQWTVVCHAQATQVVR